MFFFLSIKCLYAEYWKIIENGILILFLLHWVNTEDFEKNPDLEIIIVRRQWRETENDEFKFWQIHTKSGIVQDSLRIYGYLESEHYL